MIFPFLVQGTSPGGPVYVAARPDSSFVWTLLAQLNWVTFEAALRQLLARRAGERRAVWQNTDRTKLFVRLDVSKVCYLGLYDTESDMLTTLTTGLDRLMADHLLDPTTRDAFLAELAAELRHRADARRAAFAKKGSADRSGLSGTELDAARAGQETDETLLKKLIALGDR